jgi:ribonuclease HI
VSDIDRGTGTQDTRTQDSRVQADRDQVARREVELLDPAVRADTRRLDELLHPDFVEHGASGRIWTRQEILDELPLEDDNTPRTTATHIVAQHLTADTMLVTYRTTSTLKTAIRSSLWMKSASGAWHIRFHQGTLQPAEHPDA